ncbi:DNA polymerase epsilon subunit 3 [Anaeramoeba flamelloides]|uniref:DNA polymerase epsilon subunit 3 n=1 Tax=Anaeramoeba flamelloides TaxID=1746091 RepID=A0ABQ8X8C9_9EUKA|nr:DNA polymerase epsilon subunit 3 [Anaeramoeba flamelloides]
MEFVPTATITKLARNRLKSMDKRNRIEKNAKTYLLRSVTGFIYFINTFAIEESKKRGVKTLQPKDLYDALKMTGFEEFVQPTQQTIEKHKEIEKLKKEKKKEEKLKDIEEEKLKEKEKENENENENKEEEN